jgi:hypothetical protein
MGRKPRRCVRPHAFDRTLVHWDAGGHARSRYGQRARRPPPVTLRGGDRSWPSRSQVQLRLERNPTQAPASATRRLPAACAAPG